MGKSFRIHVTHMVTDFLIDGKWEETVSSKEWKKVEAVIEKKYPGWFHRCHIDLQGRRQVGKENCLACQRKARLKLRKSLAA